jgi:bacterioferritin
MSESAVTELNQHAADELRHATMIADRIIQLGGTPLLHPQDWLTQSGCGYKAPDNFDVLSILNDSIKGEQCAIETYSSISNITEGKDIVTYNMVNTILADEVEHEEDLQSIYDDIREFIDSFKS